MDCALKFTIMYDYCNPITYLSKYNKYIIFQEMIDYVKNKYENKYRLKLVIMFIMQTDYDRR
jgi:hypothetical protein